MIIYIVYIYKIKSHPDRVIFTQLLGLLQCIKLDENNEIISAAVFSYGAQLCVGALVSVVPIYLSVLVRGVCLTAPL